MPGPAPISRRFGRGRGHRSCRLLGLVWLALSGRGMAVESSQGLRVEVFEGGFASVNSFIFSNTRSLVVMDVQRKSDEAERLAAAVRAKGLPLTRILISHGHTDHFTGMAVFHREFPDAEIVVANDAIRRDIKAYAVYMNSGGETGAEPGLEPDLKPRSSRNPGGFDYEHWIHLLQRPVLELRGGGTLQLSTDYPATEAPHMTTVYSPELNALFLADLGYNRVHPWLGDDMTRERIRAWRAQLLRLKARYADRNPIIYPGHGKAGDMSLLDAMVWYLDDFVRVTEEAASREQAMRVMKSLYLDYAQPDFFLKYSVERFVR
jgi:glyoxylase-like metal-dependent hydrolase (beta-lactamase superfamily II)